MNLRFALLAALLAGYSPLFGQAGAQLPAYEALRTVAREKGDAWLARLVEMRGVDGDPQPAQWFLTFRDENARGGVREFVVSRRGIVSERAPVRARETGASAVMVARTLNLDSTGAFTAADKEAARAKLGFQSLNYLLENRNGTPVWLVGLFDASGAEVGKLGISAGTGAVVSPLRIMQAATAGPGSSPVSSAGPVSPDGRPLGERWVEGGGLVGHVSRWGERTWETTTNTAVRVGESIGAFFVGRESRRNGN